MDLFASLPDVRPAREAIAEGAVLLRGFAKPLEDELIAALRESLRTQPNVRFAMLFGSSATGMALPTSDVDVLVDLREDSLDSLLEVSRKLTTDTGRPVDLLRLSDAERDPALLAAALADGRVLVDREQRWPSLQKREREVTRRARAALAGIDVLAAG